MLFEWIEWDDANLEHATVRATAAEIEEAIWNAGRLVRHREHADRVLFRSVTDGGRRPGRGGAGRPRWRSTDHGMGGAVMAKSKKRQSEAGLAEMYQQTRDLSGFDGGVEEPVEVRRNVTISVRFSDEEIAQLRARAEVVGMKVTAFIRAAALDQAAPVDRQQLVKALEVLSADVDRAERLLKTESTAAPSP